LIRDRRRRSARGIEIAQGRDYRLSGLRIWRHRAHDPGDRFRIIGTDQDIVLDIQQRAVLQLAGQPPAVPEIFMQASREQRQGVWVSKLRRRAKAFVKRTADNAVMVDQRKRFVRDDGFELIFSRTGAGDVRRSSVG